MGQFKGFDSEERLASQQDLERFKKLVRNISCSRLTQAGWKIEIEDMPAPRPVYSHWMAMILLVGPHSKLTFKSHFKTVVGQSLAAPLYNVAVDQISTRQALDYMREYCNLTAGGVKRNLLSKIDMNLSLPMVSRGFDELFFKTEAGAEIDRWKLKFNDLEVICTCAFELLPGADLSAVDENEILESGDQEIEFL